MSLSRTPLTVTSSPFAGSRWLETPMVSPLSSLREYAESCPSLMEPWTMPWTWTFLPMCSSFLMSAIGWVHPAMKRARSAMRSKSFFIR